MPVNKVPDRIIIHSRDVENITGYSERSARRLLQTIRKRLGKPRHALITIQEFCWHTTIEEELVKQFLKF